MKEKRGYQGKREKSQRVRSKRNITRTNALILLFFSFPFIEKYISFIFLLLVVFIVVLHTSIPLRYRPTWKRAGRCEL